MTNNVVRLLVSIGILLVSQAALAHQQKAAISTILFNDRTNNIEVMHRFLLHDAEHAVKRLLTSEADIYQSSETQQQFANYVIERFSITNLSEQPLVLTTVGHEVDGKFMWIYQETPQIDTLQGVIVNHDALRDIWPDQTNTVNIEGKGPIKTLVFKAGDRAQGLKF